MGKLEVPIREPTVDVGAGTRFGYISVLNIYVFMPPLLAKPVSVHVLWVPSGAVKVQVTRMADPDIPGDVLSTTIPLSHGSVQTTYGKKTQFGSSPQHTV